MRVGIAQINSTVGDLGGNATRMRRVVEAARGAGAHLVLFPELAISGYPPEDLLLRPHFVRDCEEVAEELAEVVEGTVAVVGCPFSEQGLVRNGALVLGEGNILARYRKIRLPNYAVFDEERYFEPGKRVLVLATPWGRVGVNICEDIWDPCGPTEEAALLGGADLVVNISMSPYHFRKGDYRASMLAERAREAGCFVLYANGVGGQDELVFDGHSMAIAPDGGLLARGAQFEEELLLLDLELEKARETRGAGSAPGVWPIEEVPLPAEAWKGRGAVPWRGQDAGAGSGEEEVPGPTPDLPVRSGMDEVRPLLRPEAELYSALVLGVRDYVGKNGFDHVVLGLSGGVDSALTLCLAVDALGPQAVTGVSMPSRFTSTGTRSDASEIARRVGVDFLELPIEGIYSAYLDVLAEPFSDQEMNVAEENIQARIRGNLLMALSNKFGWLVLTTGNKSETAVGYTTLYGDMAGGFAVLKDVPKTDVYRLSRYRNELTPERPPIPGTVLERPPSAELAPGQTDQDTLPPYEVLDRIIEAYVVQGKSRAQMVAEGLPRDVVERVVGLIDRNEYKRRQAPPGPRVTSRAFGKDRRLPITNRYRG